MTRHQLSEDYKQKIIRIVHAIVPDAKIILFGSRARGDNRSGSDIDIALDAGYEMDRIDVHEIKDLLEASKIPYPIDVVDLNSKFLDADFKKIIQEQGITWSERLKKD